MFLFLFQLDVDLVLIFNHQKYIYKVKLNYDNNSQHNDCKVFLHNHCCTLPVNCRKLQWSENIFPTTGRIVQQLVADINQFILYVIKYLFLYLEITGSQEQRKTQHPPHYKMYAKNQFFLKRKSPLKLILFHLNDIFSIYSEAQLSNSC